MNKIEKRIYEGIEIVMANYRGNLHSLWLVGSVARDYPDKFKKWYLDIDLLAFTYTRKAKDVPRVYGEIDIDIGHDWFMHLYKFMRNRRLRNNLTRYQQLDFNKYAKRLL